MSLRGEPVEQTAVLPDGRTARIRIAVPDDPYIRKRDLDTVAIEPFVDGRVVATVNSVLDPSETSDALRVAREIAAGLESGELEPTAGAIEQFADDPFPD